MNKPVFKLSRARNAPVSDEELIADLRKVAGLLNSETFSQSQYNSIGSYNSSTQFRRFGSWNMALGRAGLRISNRINIPTQELFENILVLWQHYGRQPRQSETHAPPSNTPYETYRSRFGSWMNALKAFVDYANGTGAELAEHQVEVSVGDQHRTPRDPSLRLRWLVLQRDRFKCCACGASPAMTLGVELHVDHIYPWGKGGETVVENLQTLCSKCNLGKSNLLPT